MKAERVELRVVVLTPSGNDSSNVCRILEQSGIETKQCLSLKDMGKYFHEGASALLIAQEALTQAGASELTEILNNQEPWSDIPIILVVYGTPTAIIDLDKVFGDRINLSLLERPLSPGTLKSTVRSALRARQRQYEIRELLRNLHAAREDAVVANRIKDDFLATVSHELRNPLNGILGFAQLLRRADRSPEQLQQGLDVIERNARLQASLIDDLLDISRIVSGNLRLDMQHLDLRLVLKNAVESVRPLAEAKEIFLKLEVPYDSLPLIGDASRLQQVIWNLLTNAIKFSRKGGEVRASLVANNKEATISVIDNGTGITADFIPHVFDRFRQQDQAINRKKMGLGLGLSIVKHLVEMHLGSISVQSEGEGKGTTFTIQMPLADEHVVIEGTKNPAINVPAYEELERTIPSLRGVKILAVDDEDDSRSLIKAVLEEAGAEVLTASSAGEALVLLQEYRPDVLLSDISMPNYDGYFFIKKVRQLPDQALRNVPAIALTAFSRAEDKLKSLEKGFQAHIGKPVAAVELAQAVNALAPQSTTQPNQNHKGGGVLA